MRLLPQFLVGLLLNAVAVLASATPALAQRLPGNVAPSHYDIALEPSLPTATFAGTESISVRLERPAKTITLNAAEITFDSVMVVAGGASQAAQVSLDPAREQATLTVPARLRPERRRFS